MFEGVMLLVLLVMALVAFNLAVVCWGVNSHDGPDSREWERQRDWLRRSA